MELRKPSGKRRASAVVTCSVAMAAMIPLEHVSAQEDPWPSNADTHPGQIVYSRDVPYGSATRRFDQGDAATVRTDPTELIDRSLLVGLEPLSDAEQASISAPLSRAIGTSQTALETGLSALSSARSAKGDFTLAESGGTGVGRTITNSLGVLPGALGVIGRVLGGGE